MTKTETFFGWHEAAPLPDGEPVLLATLQAPRRRGAIVQVYSDGSLAYRFPPNPKWIRSRITVYSAAQIRKRQGENLTPEQFIGRHVEQGYVRIASGGGE